MMRLPDIPEWSRLEGQFGVLSDKVLILSITGNESGRVSTSKGVIFLAKPLVNTPLRQDEFLNNGNSTALRVDTTKVDEADETGQGWVKGDWTTRYTILSNGSIIKLFYQSTYLASKVQGAQYFKASVEAPEIQAVGRVAYRGRFTPVLRGRLVPLPLEQLPEEGIEIPPLFEKMYASVNAPVIEVLSSRKDVTTGARRGRRISI